MLWSYVNGCACSTCLAHTGWTREQAQLSLQPRVLLLADSNGPWWSVCSHEANWECPACGSDDRLLWEALNENDDVHECLGCGATFTPGYEESAIDALLGTWRAT